MKSNHIAKDLICVKRPNILFAIADDASHMSAYGHSFVKTPNFDWVAKNGVLFNCAFTTNPKCSPSRASILAGMHTWQMEEACDHYGVFPSKFKVFPDLLEDAGYHVGFTGKGWGPGDYISGGFKRNPAGNEYNEKKLIPPEGTSICDIDYSGNFKDFLKDRKNNAPFCFWYGAREPHRQYTDGEGIRYGKTLNDVSVPPYLPQSDVVKSDLLDYANEIDWFDKQLGSIVSTLRECNELENTIIVVTSDNGMPFPRVKGQMYESDLKLPLAISWGKYGKQSIVCDELISFIDFAPTFLEAAGLEKDIQMCGNSLLNIIRGEKDIERNRVFMGRERHDVGRENDAGYPVRCIRTKEYLYIHNFCPDRWPSGNPETGFTDVDSSPTKKYILNQQELANSRYFNLIFAKRGLCELYDIVNDSYCLKNLADQPEYKEIRNSLFKELKEYLIETNDPRIVGDGNTFDNYLYVGNSNHSWKDYIQGTFIKQNY